MKNMKKIIFVSLFSLILMFGVNSVQAKEQYSSYNKGDKITVNVNDNDKLDFYVIENSGSDSDKVTAIYKNALGSPIVWNYANSECNYDNSVVAQELKKRTSSWSYASNIKLPSAVDIVGSDFDYASESALEQLGASTNPEGFGMIHLENISTSPFYALENYGPTDYYTSSVLFKAEEGCNIYHYGYAQTRFSFLYVIVANLEKESNIRPVITVSKKYVDGGVIIPEEDKIWKEFIEKFKNSDAVSQFIDDGYTVVFDYDDDYLNIKLTNTEKNKTWTTSFEYADGIINYVPNTDNENLFLDSNYWIPNTLFVLSEMKGYDIDKLIFWLDDKDNLTLINDGIEFNFKEIKITQNNQFVTGSVTFDGVTSYKLDIKNGIKTYKVDNVLPSVESDEITTNPKTGSFIIIGITALVCILSFGLCLYFTNKKIKKV